MGIQKVLLIIQEFLRLKSHPTVELAMDQDMKERTKVESGSTSATATEAI